MIAICTIGGYGHSNSSFFDSLANAKVDVLVDVRNRRGMRGRAYAFLNSKALQETLAQRGIAYTHMKSLAPGSDLRATQKAADANNAVLKRERTHLSPQFVAGYKSDVLASVGIGDVLLHLGKFERPCFFCVEQHPGACHRSLAANWLAAQTEREVFHLGPARD